MMNEKVQIYYCAFCGRSLENVVVNPCNPPDDILSERDREGIKAENEKQAERVRQEYRETVEHK